MSEQEKMNGWVAWFAGNSVAANLLMIVILVAGLFSANSLVKEFFPSMPVDRVTVTVDYPSGSAVAAVEGVAIKIEEALQSVQGIKRITSVSGTGNVVVTVEMVSDYDLDKLNQDIKVHVDAISSFPGDAEKPVISQMEDIEHGIWVQLHGDTDQDVLQVLAEDLRDRLLSDPEINRVTTYGKQRPEIIIEVDEANLQALGITLADVGNRIGRSSLIQSGGELRSVDGTLVIKADQQRYRQRDFEEIVLLNRHDGTQITLADVATVKDSYDDTPVIHRFNGEYSIGLKVELYGNADIINLSRQAKLIINGYRQGLPEGISISTWQDNSNNMKDRLGIMLNNGVQGIVLVVLLLSVFLNLRVAFWVALGLPISFCGALLLMGDTFAGMSINELTTFGFIMALGIVVDDAIIVGESIHTTQTEDGHSLKNTIRGVHKVLVPATFGVLTTMVAFSSLYLIDGRMGAIFSQFGFVVVLCLLFSIIESKFILPAHLAHLQERKESNNRILNAIGSIQDAVSRGLEYLTFRLYRPFLFNAMHHRYIVFSFLAAVFIMVIGFIPSGLVHSAFWPSVPAEIITIRMVMEDDIGYGITQKEALRINRVGEELSRELQQEYNSDEPFIQNIQLTSEAANSAIIRAEVLPQSEIAIDSREIAKIWRDKVGSVEGARTLKFQTDWGGAEDIRIELSINNGEELRIISNRVMEDIRQFAGVINIENSFKEGQPQLTLSLTGVGRAMGLTMADLARQVQQNFWGFEVQRYQRGKDEIKVKVRYKEEDRSHLDDLANARIRTADGHEIPLSIVANIESLYVTNEITRIDRKPVALITADVDKDITAPEQVLAALEDTSFKELHRDFPMLQIHLEGEAAEQAETSASLIKALIAALFGIYALLAIPLRSYSQPLLIMAAIPYGLVGAILGHFLTGTTFNILSILGVIALSGVVVNDSLLVVVRANELREEGLTITDAVAEACTSRIRAILLTSTTTFAGLTPLLLETSRSAQYLIPAAISLGYGIVFATAITLLLIPLLVVTNDDFKRRFKQPLSHIVLKEAA